VIIANIIADVLIILEKDLKKALNGSGILILSGILDKKESKVLKAFKDLELLDRKQKDEWVTLLLRKREGK